MLEFFRKLFGSKNTGLEENIEPDLDPKMLLAELQPQIEATATICIQIKATPSSNIGLQESRFGGLPWFPKNEELPKGLDGKPMRLLAQLNFAEVPQLPPFPEKGILQIYLAGYDDIYGLDMDHPTLQSNWRILFFEDLDQETQTISYSETWEDSPLRTAPLALSFELKKCYPEYPSMEYFDKIAPLFEGDYEDSLSDLYIDQQDFGGHKIGGTPCFTQNEVREKKLEYMDYRLLFQMDSDDNIMWGDVGIANFFIKEKALKNKDFSRVLYNWDCH